MNMIITRNKGIEALEAAGLDTTKPVVIRYLKNCKNPPENKVPVYWEVREVTGYVTGYGDYGVSVFSSAGVYVTAHYIDQNEWEVKDGILVLDRSKWGQDEFFRKNWEILRPLKPGSEAMVRVAI